MKTQPKWMILSAVVLAGIVAFSSCKKNSVTPQLATTPLYDTLGWFAQGATGPVAGQGTKMVSDPDNSGHQIQAGRLAIRTVVNKALGVIASDTSLAKYFPVLLGEVGAGNTTGLAKLSKNFTDFVQQAVSGQKGLYTGLSMVAAHSHTTNPRFGSEANPTADSADFNEFVGDIASAAVKLNVPVSVIQQLGALLYTTEVDVVQKK